MSRSTDEQDDAGRLGRPAGLPKRWSARRKAEVVLRLLRGEDVGEVSREIRVAPPELEGWRREVLEGGQQGLKKKNRPGGGLMIRPSTCPENPDRYNPNGCSRSPGAETAVEPSSRASGCRGSGVIVAGRRLSAIHVGVKEAPEGSQCGNRHRGWRPIEPHCPRPAWSSTRGSPSWSRQQGRRQTCPRRPGRGARRPPAHDRTAGAPPITDDNTGSVSTTSRVRPGRENPIWLPCSATRRAASASRPATTASPDCSTHSHWLAATAPTRNSFGASPGPGSSSSMTGDSLPDRPRPPRSARGPRRPLHPPQHHPRLPAPRRAPARHRRRPHLRGRHPRQVLNNAHRITLKGGSIRQLYDSTKEA